MDDPAVTDLLGDGRLKTVSEHGALDLPDGVFVRIRPTGAIHSYGLGENPIHLARDPRNIGGRTVHLPRGVAA